MPGVTSKSTAEQSTLEHSTQKLATSKAHPLPLSELRHAEVSTPLVWTASVAEESKAASVAELDSTAKSTLPPYPKNSFQSDRPHTTYNRPLIRKPLLDAFELRQPGGIAAPAAAVPPPTAIDIQHPYESR